jgi:2-hydroxy-3-keto-5-methylthiopentenyl-1-phosphate phosphatase
VSGQLKLFIDFDGTIACGDIGNAFFHRFGGDVCKEWITRYHNGDISARACFEGERNAMGRVHPAEADAFVETCRTDDGFPPLIDFCRSKSIPVTVLSDGLDAYITPLLRRSGQEGLPVYSNRLTWQPAGDEGSALPLLEFPFGNAECDRCACCKRNIMLGMCAEEDVIVYVGDGYSDQCPVEFADVVFAKDRLQSWCQKKNISYYPYTDLHDVRRRLEDLTGRRIVRRRARAELRRREAFTAEA